MNTRWSREAALLGIPDLPPEAFKHVGDRKIKPQGGGGGGQQTSTGTTYTSNIPEYAQQPFMNLVGKSEALSNTPYQPFTGQRIEGFTPLQQQAQTRAANQGVAPQLGAASGLAGAAATSSFTNPGISGAYMSPYMQGVVEAQQRDASRQAGIAGTERAAQFTKAGAFGGSRQAIMDAEAARNLALQQGDIQAKGLQAAFESGQGQFNSEMNRGLQGAQTLGQLGQQQFDQQLDITGLQDKMGGQQQALNQKQRDQQYADFQAQRDYPYQQLGFLSDILRGTSGSTRTMYSSQPTAGGLQNLAGLGALAGAFFRGGAVRYAKGGIVGYAGGGAVEPLALPARLRTMSDQQLQQFAQQHSEDLFSMALAKSETDARARMRQAGAPAETPQGTVMDEVSAEMDPMTQGGIAAAVPDMDFADGGIVGYAEGGQTYPGLMKYEGAGDTLLPRTTGYEGMGIMEALRAMGVDIGNWADRKGLTGSLQDKVAKDDAEAATLEQSKAYGLGNEGRRMPMVEAPSDAAAVMVEDEKGLPKALPRPTADGQGVLAGGSRSSSSSATTRSGAPAGLAGAPAFDVKGIMEPLQKGLTEAQAADRAAADADRTDFEKDVAARGKAGEGREARIKEQQAGMAGAEERARKAAFLQAGLAILTADPSRGGLAAIAEGAGKGVAQYRGDVEKLETKREALMEKLDQIDDLRRQEANATATERRAITSKIRGLTGAAVREQVALAKDVGIPLTTAAAKMSQDRYLAEIKIKADEKNARISAGGRSNAQLGIINALSRDPNLLRTYQSMQSRGAAFDPRAEYVDYMKNFKPDPMTPGSKAMSFGEFSRMFPPAPVSGGAPPQGATIRP
jgi:hypothetical protein